jgi:lipoate-protein ligase A
MTTPACRLLPYSVDYGARNMAADETLLESAIQGAASLRFYGWSEATLSLGYFQLEEVRLTDPLLAQLPCVRRASGGATLVHHLEVTYALALPAGAPWQGSHSWLQKMHSIIKAALQQFRISSALQESADREPFQGVLCFQHYTPADLLIGSSKVVGSAQRKHRGSLLQHGAILLERSAYTPALPGISELSGRRIAAPEVCQAVADEFGFQTGWDLDAGDWSAKEQERTAELAKTKYESEKWTRKR